MDLEKMIAKAIEDGAIKEVSKQPKKNRFSPEIEKEMLVSESKRYLEKYEPKIGDIITWKSRALKHVTHPEDDGLAVVVRVLEKPLVSLSEKAMGSNYYGETEDIRAMVIMDNGNALCYMFDSQRFKKVGNIYEGKRK